MGGMGFSVSAKVCSGKWGLDTEVRIAGGSGRIGIACGVEVATGAHALLRRLVSVDADRLWRAPQDARQRGAIAALSDADARERLHSGQVVAKGYGLRETLPHPPPIFPSFRLPLFADLVGSRR